MPVETSAQLRGRRMGIAKLRLAVPILAAVSTGATAAELVNPLKVLEDSRRAGVEFDKRWARDAAEQRRKEKEQEAQRKKAEREAQRKKDAAAKAAQPAPMQPVPPQPAPAQPAAAEPPTN